MSDALLLVRVDNQFTTHIQVAVCSGPMVLSVSSTLFLSHLRMKRTSQLNKGSSQASLILRQHCFLIKVCPQDLELAYGMEHFHASHYVICHL